MFLCQSWVIYILKEETNLSSQREGNIYFKMETNIHLQMEIADNDNLRQFEMKIMIFIMISEK